MLKFDFKFYNCDFVFPDVSLILQQDYIYKTTRLCISQLWLSISR